MIRFCIIAAIAAFGIWVWIPSLSGGYTNILGLNVSTWLIWSVGIAAFVSYFWGKK